MADFIEVQIIKSISIPERFLRLEYGDEYPHWEKGVVVDGPQWLPFPDNPLMCPRGTRIEVTEEYANRLFAGIVAGNPAKPGHVRSQEMEYMREVEFAAKHSGDEDDDE